MGKGKGSNPRNVLDMYVIYERPTDYPDNFVMRKHSVVSKANAEIEIQVDPSITLDQTLDGIRSKVPPGLFNAGRTPLDESQIVEVWM